MKHALLSGVLLALVAATAAGQCGPNGCYVARPPASVSGPRTHESIARIVHHEASGDAIGSGTLVASDEKAGYVLTCAHLFESAGRTEVQLAGQSFAARVVAMDRQHDLVLLETQGGVGRPVEVTELSTSGVFTACGFGSTGELRCIRGPVTGLATATGATEPSIRIRGAVRSGDSGGPVFDAAGRLVAVVWGQRGGETYAMGGAPLRAILKRMRRPLERLEPVERTPPAESKPEADPWRDEVEKRLAQLADQPRPEPASLPDDLARRGDLQSLASRWDQRFDQLRSEVTVNVAAPIGEQVRRWLGAESLFAAVAVGGPLGLALWAGVAWLRRRSSGSQTVRQRERKVAVDTPPPPQQIVPETHYVSYEKDDFARAHQWASEQLARKFPGSVELLTSLDSLIRQQLNGEG